MSSHIKWLTGEMEHWRSEKIVTDDQAEKILSLYPEKQFSANLATLILTSVGAVIFGLGIILLFAYNWDAIPKFAKLAVVFSALLATHGFGVFFRRKGGRFVILSEALHLLGTMMFGAGIWLVAQIYNIDEHYPNAFLIWGFGALAMAWALDSIPQAVGAVILLCFWNGFEVFDFRNSNHLASLAILIAVGPLAWRLKSVVLLSVTAPAFILTYVFNCTRFEMAEHMIAPVLVFLSSVLISSAILAREKDFFKGSPTVFRFYGNIIYWISLYIFTFHDLIHEFGAYDFKNIIPSLYYAIPAIVAIGLWIAVLIPLKKFRENYGRTFRADHFCVLLTLLVLLLNRGWLCDMDGWLGAGIFNLIFLAQAIAMISFGCRNLDGWLVASGTILMTILAFTRYADLFDSLLPRAIVFLVVGALIFGTGIFYVIRKKKEQKT